MEAEHLLDGIAGDEVDQEEDQGDYEPDDWERVKGALEEGFQEVSGRWSVVVTRCIVRTPWWDGRDGLAGRDPSTVRDRSPRSWSCFAQDDRCLGRLWLQASS